MGFNKRLLSAIIIKDHINNDASVALIFLILQDNLIKNERGSL